MARASNDIETLGRILTPWKQIAVTTQVKFSVSGIPAGIERAYRVIATRKNETSGASNVAVIYAETVEMVA
jgi:hypothetical protein